MGNTSRAKKHLYTPEQRAELVAKWDKLIEGGKTQKSSAAELGVPFMNLYIWKRKATEGKAEKPKPVKASNGNGKVKKVKKEKKEKKVKVKKEKAAKVGVKVLAKLTTPDGFVVEVPWDQLNSTLETLRNKK